MKNLFVILFIVLLNAGCEPDYSGQYPYIKPIDINDGLNVDSLKAVGIDEEIIRKAVGRIDNGKYGEIHSMLIYKNEKLVFEDYFKGHKYKWDAPGYHGDFVTWDRSMQHQIHSVTKSITSLCIGIAIDKGYIRDINQSIFDYLPEHQNLKSNGKDEITIKHLLTMTSGLEWIEWGIPYSSPENPIIGVWYSDKDPVSFILDGELKYTPGTHFSYFGGNQILLGEILKNATNMPIDSFSQKYLFEPLQITSAEWITRFENGVIESASGIKMTPRDMVKIGAMILNDGVYNETRIISEKWIKKCITPYPVNTGIKIPGEDLGKVGYSYSWWTKSFIYKSKNIEMFCALGWGGQKIIIIPAFNMVLVFTGANYTSKVHEFEIFERFILSAINN